MFLNREADDPLYRQIADEIGYRIATGRLPPGARLPPLREAQTRWGVHLHTVRRAYLELRQRGLIEVRPRGATCVRRVSADPGPGESLREAVARFLARASEEFGASAAQVQAEIALYQRSRASVTVIECSRSLASSICEQLARIWAVNATPALLTEYRPPEEQAVTTVFHLRDPVGAAAGRTPTVAVRIRLSRTLVQAVAARVRRGRSTRIAICETDASFARRIAAELRGVLGSGVAVVSHTPEVIGAFLDVAERDALKLISPRLWDRLGERHRALPEVLPLVYEVDPADLRALGRCLGWRRIADTAPA